MSRSPAYRNAHSVGKCLALPPAPRPLYRSVRAGVEWLACAISLVVLLPLLLVLAAMVKLHSPGPAFYSQIRLGRGGRPFRIYKFRTMTHNCEATSGAVWARVDDPRVTPLGRVLRDTHLDELPQLWNVLRGDMSLIGPRPERPELAAQIEQVVPEFPLRLAVRPGLTGLAQMRLPADRELKRVSYKLEQDLNYIRDIGPLMDLRIAFCTLLVFVESACGSLNRLILGRIVEEGTFAAANDTVDAPLEQVDAPLVESAAEEDQEQMLLAA